MDSRKISLGSLYINNVIHKPVPDVSDHLRGWWVEMGRALSPRAPAILKTAINFDRSRNQKNLDDNAAASPSPPNILALTTNTPPQQDIAYHTMFTLFLCLTDCQGKGTPTENGGRRETFRYP